MHAESQPVFDDDDDENIEDDEVIEDGDTFPR